ncbi:transposase [Sphingobacterium sp. DK4209]|uniref:Transposase n=1 Tax=Sphingobacterium zhuxiongii TaxID=2662364 RepID=A0A5Q0QE57_9SPHI|nr:MULTISPECIES: transposase [unclassified Sphingobacterium]MVZ67493.1 transposase [Sphingobacterium sp. DK4209]QGA27221.1 transposase [Sphingobacterium sp. dk4302]
MKNLAFIALGISMISVSCQNNQETQNQKLGAEAIRIHDEIMPQISTFDKTTVKIDSILAHLADIKTLKADLDTTAARVELTSLKDSIEAATDNMMTWMKDYDATSTDETYQQKELDKITIMQKQFESVNGQINKSLTPFN